MSIDFTGTYQYIAKRGDDEPVVFWYGNFWECHLPSPEEFAAIQEALEHPETIRWVGGYSRENERFSERMTHTSP